MAYEPDLNLQPAGSILFSDSEGFLQELSAEDESTIAGGARSGRSRRSRNNRSDRRRRRRRRRRNNRSRD